MDKQTILGIDIGTNSLGWALIKKDSILTGVRVFDAGLAELEMDGKGKSRNIERREKRGIRRLIERRSKRLHNLARLLQQAGLLPKGEIDKPDKRHSFFEQIDKKLNSPYILRSRALKEKLSLEEFGRAIYHLGQRRGFLSNRKSKTKKDEDTKGIKKDISELEKNMSEVKAQTLGEYYSTFIPEKPIRGRYTSRQMYEDEFNLIWEKQKAYYPDILNEDLKNKIYHTIFYQRPIRKQKHLIGECTLEKNSKRAPLAILPVQRFRYLQTLNNLRILNKDTGNEYELTQEERKILIDALETQGDLTFSNAKKLLNLGKIQFNLEKGGEKKIPGNRTSEKLIKVFGEKWKDFDEATKAQIVEDLRSIVKEETLKKRGMKVWGLSEEQAEELSQIELEDGYCSFSKKAIDKLLPLLAEGIPLQTAINEIYPDRRNSTNPMDTLPPVRSEAFGELRNPIIERSLTELRRVVNALIRKHGKPDLIRIELARELRQSAEQRKKTWEQMRKNEKQRKEAREKIIAETNISDPPRRDIEKVLLAEECGWICPYTGRHISMASLFGDNLQFDVEHIIPFDRCLDNSFLNKTLCDAEENRNRKHNKTPYEAYHGTEKWDEIILRVKNFKGDARYEKLKRFQLTESRLEDFLSDFTSRQLNDTRYASKLAKKYLGLLYGGLDDDGIDVERKRRVQAIRGGQITANLRNAWCLNSILKDGAEKSRDDHRHHAIDAIVVALTEPSTIEALSRAVKNAKGKRFLEKVELPWEGFLNDVRNAVNSMNVSHRVSKKVSGALHEETFYSPPREDDNGKTYVCVRKRISALSAKDIEDDEVIIDRTVRERIKAKLIELGENDPKKAFKDPVNHPYIETKDGRGGVPIHGVKIRLNLKTFPVGKDYRIRHVQSDSNHHMEIVETKDKRGNVKWEGYVVSMYEAYQRLKRKEPIIKTDHGEGKKFLFSLANNEVIELDNEDTRSLYVVRTVPKSTQIRFVPINDGRKLKDIPKAGYTAMPESLRNRNCKKVVVNPLGEIHYAND